jgi:ferrochelatase
LKWIGPATEDAIQEAARDGVGVLISPIAFVSEHVETLVELDHEYAELAVESGVAPYLRARTPGVGVSFISELGDAVQAALGRTGVAAHGGWQCPPGYAKCACREAAA